MSGVVTILYPSPTSTDTSTNPLSYVSVPVVIRMHVLPSSVITGAGLGELVTSVGVEMGFKVTGDLLGEGVIEIGDILGVLIGLEVTGD